MSQENVDLSRRFWMLFNDREWDAWWDLMAEDIEWHARSDKPDVEIYYGQESLKRLVDSWMEMFPDLRLEFTGESIDLGDQVITPTDLLGTARTTGIALHEPYSWLFKISERKIVLAHEFHNNEEALEAAEPQG